MIFETQRLIIRKFELEDLDFFAALNGDEEVVRYIRPAKTKEESLAFLYENLQLYNDKPGMGRWMCIEKITNQPIGSAAYFPVKDTEEIQIGYAFLKPFWGKGYAKEVTAELINYARQRGDKTIVAITEEENVPSQKVLTANEFHFESAEKTNDGKTLFKFRLNF